MSVTVNAKSNALTDFHVEIPAFRERFPFMRPTLPELKEVIEEYQSTYEKGLLTNSGLVARLEGTVAERLGVKHCIAVSSCTSGLMMVLRALGGYRPQLHVLCHRPCHPVERLETRIREFRVR